MSVSTYISSIESSRNVIRNKLVELGMASSSDKLDKLATAIETKVETVKNKTFARFTGTERGSFCQRCSGRNGCVRRNISEVD